MRRILLSALFCICAGASSAKNIGLVSAPAAPLYWNFLTNQALPPWVGFTRANCSPSSSCATNAQYTDAAGASFSTFATNVPVFSSTLGVAAQESRVNYLVNSGAPVTQTTASLATGYYALFCNGTGSITSSAGTATASGVGALTCNSSTFQVIDVTGSGTISLTVAGSVNWGDLQNLPGGATSTPTTHIVSGASATTRAVDSFVPAQALKQFAIAQPNSASYVAEFTTQSAITYTGILADSATGHFNFNIFKSGTSSSHPYSSIAGASAVLASCGAVVTVNSLVRYGATIGLGNFLMSANGSSCTKGGFSITSAGVTGGYTALFSGANLWVTQFAAYPYQLSQSILNGKTTAGATLP